jgi:hypothetical protein
MDMNNQIRLLSLLLLLVAFASGCESGGAKSTDEFSITPATAKLEPGGTVVLTAVGGHAPLLWTLDDPTAGQLSTTNGQSVTYMAQRAVPIQGYLFYTNTVGIPPGVTNIVRGVMNTITVTDSETWTATAVITQYYPM